MNNYNMTFIGLFHHIPDNNIGKGEVGLLYHHLKLEGHQVTHLLFIYAVLWMKVVKAIGVIDIVIANNSIIIRLGVPTHQHSLYY